MQTCTIQHVSQDGAATLRRMKERPDGLIFVCVEKYGTQAPLFEDEIGCLVTTLGAVVSRVLLRTSEVAA